MECYSGTTVTYLQSYYNHTVMYRKVFMIYAFIIIAGMGTECDPFIDGTLQRSTSWQMRKTEHRL